MLSKADCRSLPSIARSLDGPGRSGLGRVVDRAKQRHERGTRDRRETGFAAPLGLKHLLDGPVRLQLLLQVFKLLDHYCGRRRHLCGLCAFAHPMKGGGSDGLADRATQRVPAGARAPPDRAAIDRARWERSANTLRGPADFSAALLRAAKPGRLPLTTGGRIPHGSGAPGATDQDRPVGAFFRPRTMRGHRDGAVRRRYSRFKRSQAHQRAGREVGSAHFRPHPRCHRRSGRRRTDRAGPAPRVRATA